MIYQPMCAFSVHTLVKHAFTLFANDVKNKTKKGKQLNTCHREKANIHASIVSRAKC